MLRLESLHSSVNLGMELIKLNWVNKCKYRRRGNCPFKGGGKALFDIT